MPRRTIYLDHNATTPLRSEVRAAMHAAIDEIDGNPSSLHAPGRRARRAVEDAREEVARLFGDDPRRVLFTSGATEANQTAISLAARKGRRQRIAISAIEHPSVSEPARACFPEVVEIPVDREGFIDQERLAQVLGEGVDLLATHAANNEIGTVQEVASLAELCREHETPLHLDAVQLPGKVPLAPLEHLEEGSLAISAHKFGGPKGVGALIGRGETGEGSWLVGGGQERGRRGGTENLIGILGFGRAARCLHEQGPATEHLLELESVFLGTLREAGLSHQRHGPVGTDKRLPGTIALRIAGLLGEDALLQLDMAGICVSLGSACSSGAMQPSHVLQALGVDRRDNLETIRVSFGLPNTIDEARVAAETVAHLRS